MDRGKLARTAWAFSAYPDEDPEAVGFRIEDFLLTSLTQSH